MRLPTVHVSGVRTPATVALGPVLCWAASIAVHLLRVLFYLCFQQSANALTSQGNTYESMRHTFSP